MLIANAERVIGPLTLPSPRWGEGTHFISPPLRGGDEGEGELCQFI
jgi:hypothetical protein